MLIIEDYLLLLFDDVTGKPIGDTSHLEVVGGGALLVELALLGRVDLASDGRGGHTGRVVVRDAGPTGNALLDEALVVVRSREGKKPTGIVAPLAKLKPATRALGALADCGILRREAGHVLGIFPTTRWPAVDSRYEEDLRLRLRHVLIEGAEPDERLAALVAILSAVKQAGRVLAPARGTDAPLGSLTRREVDRRAKAVAQGSWAGDATKKYIAEITAATTAAITSSIAASSAAANSN